MAYQKVKIKGTESLGYWVECKDCNVFGELVDPLCFGVGYINCECKKEIGFISSFPVIISKIVKVNNVNA